ncbi:MAG: hypothetical protein JJU19_06500 [Pararhodobacter sp.]|nr:hypothetical protein [Pararhodobacter sp.]
MKKSSSDAWPFEAVVGVLEARSRHLLNREGRIGSAMPLTAKARIGDDELRERFMRLRRALTEFRRTILAANKDQPGILNLEELQRWTGEIEAGLNVGRFSDLPETDIEVRLHRLWAALDAILSEVDAAGRAAGDLADPLLLQLSPDEIRALTAGLPDEALEQDDTQTYPPEAIKRIICLVHLRDIAGRCVSETRAILAGRFHYNAGRGSPQKLRGGRLAVELLGMAEGLGLKPTRDHDSPRHSAADAVIAALKRCRNIDDQAARIVLAETPKTFDAFARRLWPKCREGETLFSYRDLGRILGERMRHRT